MLQPVLSDSSESHVRSYRATRDRVGPSAAAGRPASPWRAAGRRVRVGSEWREGGAPPAEGLVAPPRQARRRGTASGPGLRGRPVPAGPSIMGELDQNQYTPFAQGRKYRDSSLVSRDSVKFIFPLTCTLC